MIDEIGRIRELTTPVLLHTASRANQDINAAEVEITSGNQYTATVDEYVYVEVLANTINTTGTPAKISIRVVINDGNANEASYDKEVEMGSALTRIRWLSNKTYKMDATDVMSVFIYSDDAADTTANISCNIFKATA